MIQLNLSDESVSRLSCGRSPAASRASERNLRCYDFRAQSEHSKGAHGVLWDHQLTGEEVPRIRSEADRETLENHWFHFTRKLLILNRGPGTLETLGIRQQPGDYTTSRPGPSEGMMSSSEAVLKGCRHPKEYETRGANQHGTWTCCNLCQQKTGYQKYGKDNPPPAVRKSRTAAVETYVPKTPAAAPRTPMVQASSSTMSLMPDLESAFRGQNEQLLQNTASIMSQVMTPVVEGFHQALRFQAEEAQRNQERQEIQLQQLFMQQQRIMQQTDPATQPGAAFPALAPEELHRLLAQGFAMAQQVSVPEDEDWDQIPEHAPGRAAPGRMD